MLNTAPQSLKPCPVTCAAYMLPQRPPTIGSGAASPLGTTAPPGVASPPAHQAPLRFRMMKSLSSMSSSAAVGSTGSLGSPQLMTGTSTAAAVSAAPPSSLRRLDEPQPAAASAPSSD